MTCQYLFLMGNTRLGSAWMDFEKPTMIIIAIATVQLGRLQAVWKNRNFKMIWMTELDLCTVLSVSNCQHCGVMQPPNLFPNMFKFVKFIRRKPPRKFMLLTTFSSFFVVTCVSFWKIIHNIGDIVYSTTETFMQCIRVT